MNKLYLGDKSFFIISTDFTSKRITLGYHENIRLFENLFFGVLYTNW